LRGAGVPVPGKRRGMAGKCRARPSLRARPLHRSRAVAGLRRRTRSRYEEVRTVTVRARAPLRLGLAGGGTDVSPYCDLYGGQVMNATIDRYAYAIVSPRAGRDACFHALDVGHEEIHACDGAIDGNGPLQLLKGVYARISRDFLHGVRPPLSVRTFSDAPPGSGLGSSSTMVVALVQAFVEYFSLPLGEYEVAQLAYDIERKDL